MSKLRVRLLGGAVMAILFYPGAIQADTLSFSITPTIFEMSAAPGQAWKTSLKVINNNPYELTVYAVPVNFEPKGELGHGSFVPVFAAQTDGSTLAEWMSVAKDPIIIPKESSVSVPVQLNVPTDAAPGGHYAAVMVGTRPPESDQGLQIRTSQIITSLFFVTVAGDVIENGEVRTFRAARRIATTPEMSFNVRFENKGNVHLQPQGEILITNMWGKERGRIPINRETNFGNVLPESIREFDFSWKGERSFTDIGRYRATLSLGYGSAERHFVTREIAFWVIPLKPLVATLAVLVFIVWFVTRSVRAYVRYMLRMSGIDPDTAGSTAAGNRYVPRAGDVKIERRVTIKTPLVQGYRDLQHRLAMVSRLSELLRTLIGFITSYRIFFGSVFLALMLVGIVWYYLASVTSGQRDYEVTIDNPDNPVTLSSEQIMYDAANGTAAVPDPVDSSEQAYTLSLVNSSDTPGQAARLADALTAAGYRVDDLQSDFSTPKTRSVVVYSTALETEALALSQLLHGALLSAYATTSESAPQTITVFIGNDYAAGTDSAE